MNDDIPHVPEWMRSWIARGSEAPVVPLADDSTLEPWEQRRSNVMRWTPDLPVPFDRTASDPDLPVSGADSWRF